MARKAPTKRPTEAGFREIANRFRILGDTTRLRIVYLLQDAPMSVGQITEALGCSQPNASRHLAKLLSGGIVQRQQRGVVVEYSIADPTIFRMCDIMCNCLADQVKRTGAALFEP